MPTNNRFYALFGATTVLFLTSLYLVFFVVPTDVNEGATQRIFYTHVPVAIIFVLPFFMVAVFSILHLIKRNLKWDRLAASTAEVGVMLGALVLIQGMIWSKNTHNVWWSNDPKEITSLILVLVFVAYLIFRAYFPAGLTRARLSAVIAIAGSVNAVMVYFAENLFGSLTHPDKVVSPVDSGANSLGAVFLPAFLVSLVATSLLIIMLIVIRYRIANAEYRHQLERGT